MVKIEDLNDDLFKLKLTTGRTIKALSRAKNDLDGEMAQSNSLDKDIKLRKDQLARVRDELDILREEIAQAKKIKKRLNQEENAAAAGGEETNSGMPHILDYVAQKAELYRLNDAVKNWSKKVRTMHNLW